MRTAEATPGRRIVVILEPGDEVLSSLAEASRRHDVAQAAITTFSGALRNARLIASDTVPADPELPLPESVEIFYTEGVGSGTITRGADGEPVVHVHVALGAKDRSGLGAVGHLLHGETHYVVEIVLEEILAPTLVRRPHPGSSGIPILDVTENDTSPESV
ncbi:PPC domain-containing DNA-binding protein [Microbacterium sp. NPDC089189]|uniref:PPC domain-containing DNA-binding protein n=1 Tax=Microbacterium sp. NPDC089189 TaxID=3154972 RepID=UPI003445746E